jgi:PAS domain S-box-containing protein
MGQLMRSQDWSLTSIGAVESWSPALRMMVKILLANRFPLLLWWGSEFCQIYNDAYRPVLGTKHPRSLGQPAHECWPEIWDVIGPLIETPFHGGEATWMDDIALAVNRRGFVEETHFTIAYSPVPDDSVVSGIGGVLATVHEITEKVVGERRISLLHELGARSAEAKTAEEACSIAAQTLAGHPKDVPFAVVYLLDGERKLVRLAGAAGVNSGEAESRFLSDLGDVVFGAQPWRFPEATGDQALHLVDNLNLKLPHVPAGPWSDPPQTAVVLPIPLNMPRQFAGVLVLGVSSRLKFDDSYRGFVELVTGQVGTLIATASAYEEERKRAEALAEIDRAKTRFFSNVSHEFRTPLTLILVLLQAMLERADGSYVIDHGDLDLLNRNAQRLLKLVNALLDFSRIEAGRTFASFAPTDLPAFTAELTSVFRSATDRAGLKLLVDCPPLAEPVYVDQAMWEKIVLNLLSNAFKFTFEGEIAVSLRQAGQHAELSVSDTGTGIPEHELPHIFDRFHRVEGAQGRTYEGSGIGLALVLELVRIHGGTVRAKSTYGQGSRFTVSVPLGKAHLAPQLIGGAKQSFTVGAAAYAEQVLHWLPDPPSALRVAEEAMSSRNSASRILLVDDNGDMRRYLQRLLAVRYEVEAIGDGEAAIAAARENLPDLVVADVMMPRLDGFGLLKALRNDPRTRDIPVIMLSARAGEESRVEGLEAGADDYLIKPFSARELLARVRARLEIVKASRATVARERELARAQALRKSAEDAEERISTVLESVTDGFVALDQNWRLTYVNYAVLEQVGRRREELLGRNLWELYPEALETIFEREYRRAMAERVPVTFESYWAPHDLWLSVSVYPSSHGGLAIYSRDITKQKRVEQALHASEERFRRYFELGLVGMAITSPDKSWIEINDELCKILGYERSELIGKTWLEMIHPDDQAESIANFNRVMAGECDGHTLERRWIRKDGQVIFSRTSYKCLRPEDGSVDYFVGMLEDITARKQAEEAHQRSHNIIENIADGFFAIDRNWRYSYVNPAGELLVGKSSRELLGHNLWEVFPETVGTIVEEQYRRAVAENVPVVFETYFEPLDRWFSVSAFPSGDGLAINGRDITQKRRVEMEVARKNDELKRLVATVQEMADDERRALENKLAAELAAVARLHEFSNKLMASTDLQPLIEELLDAAISLQNADFGIIQLYDTESPALSIVAQRGFQLELLDPLGRMHGNGIPGGGLIKEPARVIIEDVHNEPDFEPYLRIADSAGFRSVHSTPLFNQSGEPRGAMSTYFRRPHRPSDHELRLTDLYALHATELIARKQNEMAVLRYQRELQAVTAKLIEAREMERMHLARELHDVFSQKLAVIGMEMAALGRKLPRSSQVLRSRLQDLTEQIGNLTRNIHQISRQLHPAILEDLGLEAALRNECLAFSEQHTVPVDFIPHDVPQSLSEDVSVCLYRVTQESLRNIGKHARADEVRVGVTGTAGEIVLLIEDIGDGFDLQQGRGKGGLGLISMEERVRAVNGSLTIRSRPGAGTHIEVRVPLRRSEV